MASLPVLPGDDIVRIFKCFGWSVSRQKGSHMILTKPAPFTLPNLQGLAPGAKAELYSFDHDLSTFVSVGTGTVSEDGSIIASDPGFGIIKGGWHGGGDPSPPGGAGDGGGGY